MKSDNILYISWLAFICLVNYPSAWAQSVPIVPAPQMVVWGEGYFPLDEAIELVSPSDLSSTSIELLDDIFWYRASHAKRIVRVGLWNEDKGIRKFCLQRGLDTENLDPEGYHLSIQENSIHLIAGTPTGLFYGLQSLKQLATGYRQTGRLPTLLITDFPSFRNRAVMDDISRGPLSNMRFLKEQIRKLAALKVNHLTFYIEHVVKTKGDPNFSPPDAITIDEFEALTAYAKQYHIELIGSFQSLGHFRNILSHPEYRKLGASDRMLKPADPEVLDFLKSVYSEMLPAFSSPYFNINADEAWDLVRGSMKSVSDSVGAGNLFGQHIQPLLSYLDKSGKRPMLWGDMLLAHPEAFSYLPKGTTVLTWEYGALKDYSAWIDPLQQRKLDFWVCPGILNSNKIIPDVQTNFTNLQHFIKEGKEKGASGVMTTIWDDGGGHLFARDWYPLAYAAEQMWKPNSTSTITFDQRFAQALYADTAGHLPKVIRILNQIRELPSTQQLNNAFFQEQLLPKVGDVHQLYLKDVQAILKIANAAEEELEKWDLSGKDYLQAWIADIASWRLLIDHLQVLAESYQAVLDLAHRYEVAQDQGQESRSMIPALKSQAHEFRKQWEELRLRYIDLWFQENRAYSLEVALQPFNQKIQDFLSLETLLGQSMAWPADQPLPAPSLLRLEISENPDRHFRFWLLSPFYPIKDEENKEQDFLESLGGEEEARPTPYDWLKYQSPYSDKIDFQEALSVEGTGVVYTYARIESPAEKLTPAHFDHLKPIAIFLNGQRLPSSQHKTDLLLPLKAGKNHLILKFLCTGKQDRFSFLLPAKKLRNRKQKYKIME
ncbi:MAG: beta-N-acetylhexosaminidase [Saprospiraceae bacterium]|nr:beta-N-acetylhexosaminidase [Saprospiraceae bacterium]